jgi:hypothetical protein
MNCIKCNSEIAAQRIKILPNTKTCTICSDEEAFGAVNIVYHKTGNTIQIMDKHSADSINKSARRSGFGSLRAMKGGSGGSDVKAKLGTTVFIPRKPTQEDFESTGKKMMDFIDWKDREEVIEFLDDELSNRNISTAHYRKLVNILDQLKPKEKVIIIPEMDVPVSDDVNWAFNNWKNSKLHR